MIFRYEVFVKTQRPRATCLRPPIYGMKIALTLEQGFLDLKKIVYNSQLKKKELYEEAFLVYYQPT